LRKLLLLAVSWAAGLAAYGGALWALRGDVLSLDNWTIIGSITLVAWLVSSLLVTLPVLLRLTRRRARPTSRGVLAGVGVTLAIVPVWLNVGVWYGWHPRHLFTAAAALLSVQYATSGLILSLALPWAVSREPRSSHATVR
jgi:hypothetical protein